VHRCSAVKIEMNVSGSSRKGRDSLSPHFVLRGESVICYAKHETNNIINPRS